MIVLVCIPCLLTGGTEIQTFSLVKALVAAGHKPVVACYFEYAEEMVERYRTAGAEVRLMSLDGSRPKGIKAVTKHLYKGFRKIVKEAKPDVAHVQYMTPGALAIVILKFFGVTRIIATSHTDANIYSPNGLRIIRFLTRYVLSGFQCITLRAEQSYFGASSLFDGTKESLRKNHFTIYNCLPTHIEIKDRPTSDLLGAQTSDNSGQKTLTIGVVSRLEKIKGMDLVVPAFARVAKKYSHVRLLVVGDGSMRQLMERQTVEARLTDRVEFIGRQSQQQLQKCYDKIDILLMPSRSEGFGLTAIEGMARGCVPVVANTGGLPEVVTSDCGLLHAPENMDDLANKISILVSDTCKITKMSEAARSRAEIFSSESYGKAIKHLYSLI